ncbi:MAG TPA: hypothetical protein VFB67_05560 [Candidatus Polarisedimenticolaceae bacterium]|nr:hypothetical protein [Candidatus Polarisedimenticolaceae bacterium]
MVYRASREPRVVAARSAAAVILFLGGATLLLVGPPVGGSRLPTAAAGAVAMIAACLGAASGFLIFLTRYELTRFDLIIRSGLTLRRIPLECIEGVLPVLPAHVTIVYQRNGRPGTAIITPQEPRTFLRDLQAATPFLERVGDRLLRKPALLTTR